MKERASNKILRQYCEPIKDQNENGCFSEFLSVKYDRMGKLAGDELLNEEPDANWKCKACNHKRQWSLECCFLAREQVAIDFDTNVFVPCSWSQRRKVRSILRSRRKEEICTTKGRHAPNAQNPEVPKLVPNVLH